MDEKCQLKDNVASSASAYKVKMRGYKGDILGFKRKFFGTS